MSLPRRPDVITSVFLKPSLRASGPIISCAPGPSMARGNGWNSLIGNGWRSSSTCMVAPLHHGWIGTDVRAATALSERKTVAGAGRTLRSGRCGTPPLSAAGGGGNVPSDLGGYGSTGDDRRGRDGAVGVREPHLRRVVGHAGFEPDIEPGGVDDEQQHVGAAGEQAVRGQLHLLRGGQVHEPVAVGGGEGAAGAGERPVGGGDEVQQGSGHGGRSACRGRSLPRLQRSRNSGQPTVAPVTRPRR